MFHIEDQTGRRLNFPSTPKRIVSLVPSLTELVVDLGLEENLFGITRFCVHPPHLKKEKTILGGTKKVNLKKLQALDPDIILCNKEENTKEMVSELEKIATVHVSDVSDLSDTYELIGQYGNIFDRNTLSEKIVSEIKLKVGKLALFTKGCKKKRVAYLIWNDPIMVAGKGTFIDAMLQLNNFENACQKKRYPVTSLQELERLELDYIFLSSEPYPFKAKHKEIFKGISESVIIVNGEYFSWYGSRLLKAMDYFTQLHL